MYKIPSPFEGSQWFLLTEPVGKALHHHNGIVDDIDEENGHLNYYSMPALTCENCENTFYTGDIIDFTLNDIAKDLLDENDDWPVDKTRFVEMTEVVRSKFATTSGSFPRIYPGNKFVPGVWSFFDKTPIKDFYWPKTPESGLIGHKSVLDRLRDGGVINGCSTFELLAYQADKESFNESIEYFELYPATGLYSGSYECTYCESLFIERYGTGIPVSEMSTDANLLFATGLGIVADFRFKREIERGNYNNLHLIPLSESQVARLQSLKFFGEAKA